MKNITVTVEDELYHRARIRAAREGTNVSAVVRNYLRQFIEGESPFERLKREESELRAQLLAAAGGVRAAERMSREEAHCRASGNERPEQGD